MRQNKQNRMPVLVVGRRRFLKGCVLATTALIVQPALAGTDALKEKSLSFYNTHTGEKTSTVYWANGLYIDESLAEINRILRDHRTGDMWPMAPGLLDLLFDLRLLLETQQPFHVISGYRSPATNNMLWKTSGGVAKTSLHTVGRAIDIRVPGRDLVTLRRTAMYLGRGGVGYYPASDFVHVDTGRVRCW